MRNYVAKQPTATDLVQVIEDLRAKIIRQYSGELILADTDRKIILISGKVEAADEIFSQLISEINKKFQA